MYEQLRQHQDRAREIMVRAEAILDGRPRDTMALGQTRWELARALRAYQLYKHNSVFDPIIASDRADRIAMAQDMKTRCIRMAERFTAYLLHWSAVSVGDLWDEHRVAAIAMFGALREHLDRERDGIARLEASAAIAYPSAAVPAPPAPRIDRARSRY